MKPGWRTAALAVGVSCAWCPGARAQAVYYVDVTGPCGLLPQVNEDGQTNGLNAIDFDQDGDIDLFVPQAHGTANRLYQNNGDGTFTDVASTLGLAMTESARVALWFDYDADQDLDLLLYNDKNSVVPTRLRLMRNDTTTFTDVTSVAGVYGSHFVANCGGLSAGDVNNDGYLDFFVGPWAGSRRLYLNDGDGTFTNITTSSGIGGSSALVWQSLWYDFDGDGWQDLYIAADDDPNELWINQQDGTFIESAAGTGLANDMNDMGITPGDYDNDGDLDLYISNIYRNDQTFGFRHNVLLRNDSVGATVAFTDVSTTMAVGSAGWGWGVVLFDHDNDTLLDIAATNGFGNADGTNQNNDPSKFFRNVDGGASAFADISTPVNFDDTDWGSALVSLDYDNDGALDLAQICMAGPLRLMRNEDAGARTAHNWIVIRPRMDGNNFFAIGATVRVTVGSVDMMRLITCGTSLAGQEPALAHFGLGGAAMVDSITVEWPDGTSRTITDIPANQSIDFLQTPPPVCAGDVDGDGATDVFDFAILVSHFGDAVPVGTLGDLDPDGLVNVFDFAILAGDFGCPN